MTRKGRKSQMCSKKNEPKDSNFLEHPPSFKWEGVPFLQLEDTPHCCNKKPTSRHVIAGHEEVLNDIIGSQEWNIVDTMIPSMEIPSSWAGPSKTTLITPKNAPHLELLLAFLHLHSIKPFRTTWRSTLICQHVSMLIGAFCLWPVCHRRLRQ